MFNQFNEVRYIDWGKNTEGFEFLTLSYLHEGDPYRVYGFFTTRDRGYGETPVAILENCFVSLPQRYLDVVKSITDKQDCVAAIIAGHCAIKYSRFTSKKFNREGYSVEFMDI